MNSFLGRAAAYPLRPNGRGGLALVEDEEAVEDSIRAIIESVKGSHRYERWLGIPQFLFKPMADLHAAAQGIKDAIIAGDDRVDPDSLIVLTNIDDGGQMQITVTYQVVGIATERTLALGFRKAA